MTPALLDETLMVELGPDVVVALDNERLNTYTTVVNRAVRGRSVAANPHTGLPWQERRR